MAPKAKRAPSSPPHGKAAVPKAAAAKPAAKPAAAPAKAAAKAAVSKAPPPKAAAPVALDPTVEEASPAAPEAVEAAREAAEAERQRKEQAEAELARLAALANGQVTVKYNMYAEKFSIQSHVLTAKAVDELYCLSDVMPGCFIHLAEREYGYGEEQIYLKEDPPGTFRGLMAGETYWCYVQQDAEQERKDQEATRHRWADGVAAGVGNRGAEGESCSCGWGAPCTNPMICRDWDNRFANAIKAGGNPTLFTT